MPSNPKEVEDLRRDSATNPLIAFTFEELKLITGNFRQDRVLGGGGFGSVYKGFITEDLREGIVPLPVAVKVHDGFNSYQGHREWLVVFYFSYFVAHIWFRVLSNRKNYCFLGRSHISGAAFSSKFGKVDWILLRRRASCTHI